MERWDDKKQNENNKICGCFLLIFMILLASLVEVSVTEYIMN